MPENIPEELEGTTPPQEDKENEPRLLDPEKVDRFLRQVICILYKGRQLEITKEGLQTVVEKAIEKLKSTYDSGEEGERFRAEDY